MRLAPVVALVTFAAALPAQAARGGACALDAARMRRPLATASGPADLVLLDARIHTLAWPDPAGDGTPHPAAPWRDGRWHPDATALAVRDGRIVAVGDDAAVRALVGPRTMVRTMRGRTVLPGFVDAHTHVAEYGESLRRADLVGLATPDEAIAALARWARATAPAADAWLLGQGWDEGAWADRRLTAAQLDARFPGRAVYLRGLHGFAGWASSAALRRAGITRDTPDPVGGVIERDAAGRPTGVVRNRAVALLDAAIPAPTAAEARRAWALGLARLADSGYVGVHEAGVDARRLKALRGLARGCALPVRAYIMASARDTALARALVAAGPDTAGAGGVTVRAIKAYYDGALGSRGARLLAPYADAPEAQGVAGAAYGFDSALVARLVAAGFQVGIHAIGDAGNREVLDFLDATGAASPAGRARRHRIEHAQVVAEGDVPRFAALGVVPSVQPVHAVEDLVWAGRRLGTTRLRGAYAWRSLRRTGATLPLGSDLPGSGFGIGYGLHSAVTRQDTTGAPAEGWFPEQRLTIEEAVRGYTTWARRAALEDSWVGTIAPGMAADLTVLDRDPFDVAPRELRSIVPCATVVAGRWRDTGRCSGGAR